MIPGTEYNESKLRLTIPRPWLRDKIVIYLLGAENPDSIRGLYLDGVIMDEYASMDPRVWNEVIRAALSDRLGWAIFISTPAGQNHFYDVYNVAVENKSNNWASFVYKASETKIIPFAELEALRAEMSEEAYEQEFECSFSAGLTGAYWGKQMSEAENAKRICRVPHDPALRVDTFWDLGVNDTTTIWFLQQYRNELRMIDYFEMSGEGIPFYAKEIRKGHRSEYDYRMHNWPHDGRARDLSANGETREQVALGLGLRPLIVHPKFDPLDSIDAVRRLLPRMWFDAEKCRRGIEALKNYQKKYDTKNKIYMKQPLHNWASHGADAMRLLGMSLRPGEDRASRREGLPTKCNNDYDMFG